MKAPFTRTVPLASLSGGVEPESEPVTTLALTEKFVSPLTRASDVPAGNSKRLAVDPMWRIGLVIRRPKLIEKFDVPVVGTTIWMPSDVGNEGVNADAEKYVNEPSTMLPSPTGLTWVPVMAMDAPTSVPVAELFAAAVKSENPDAGPWARALITPKEATSTTGTSQRRRAMARS